MSSYVIGFSTTIIDIVLALVLVRAIHQKMNIRKFEAHNNVFVWTYIVIVVLATHLLPYVNLEFFSPRYFVYVRVLVSFAEYVMILMISNGFDESRGQEQPVMFWIMTTIVPLGSLVIFSMLFGHNGLSANAVSIIGVALIIIDALIFAMYIQLNRMYNKAIEDSRVIEQNRLYKEQIAVINEAYESVRDVKHNIINDLNSIKILLEAGEKDKVDEYIDNILGSAGFNIAYINSGNRIMDGILNYKCQAAKQQGVEVRVNLIVPQKLSMDEFDLSNIIGNLLDNAVRAAQNADKKVDMEIRYNNKGMIIINVVNRYVDELNMDERGNLLTTKEDVSKHGIGLKSIRKIVDKYSGEIKIETENNIFAVTILMCVN